MSSMQQQINDLVMGKHKDWHLYAVKTSTYGELGREWLNRDEPLEFVAGFDTWEDANAAMEKVERSIENRLQYGGDDFDFTIHKRGA